MRLGPHTQPTVEGEIRIEMSNQTTIKRCVSLTGVSITGEPEAKISFCPAPPNTGIVFVRNDLPDQPKIKCSFKRARVEFRWSSLIQGNVRIEHTEHALAAVAGLGLDNLIIELDQPSLPVMSDYSSMEYSLALIKAEIVEQPFERKKIRILKPIIVHKSDKCLLALPYDGFKITYALDYPNLSYMTQTAEIEINPLTFVNELAGARSFILESEMEEVINLTGNASSNVLVIKSSSEKEHWLWPNELARHKALDLLGDLNLLGEKLIGHVIGIRTGHRLNLDLCKKIYRECKNDSFD